MRELLTESNNAERTSKQPKPLIYYVSPDLLTKAGFGDAPQPGRATNGDKLSRHIGVIPIENDIAMNIVVVQKIQKARSRWYFDVFESKGKDRMNSKEQAEYEARLEEIARSVGNIVAGRELKRLIKEVIDDVLS